MKSRLLNILVVVGLLLPGLIMPGTALAIPPDDLVITGVIDGPLTGGVPKAVELYAINSIPDLSIYGLGSANNGGGTDGQEFTFPAITVDAGTCIWVASEGAGFTSYFGFAPDYITGAMSVNGDDAIELFVNGSVSDVFGEINVDGTGQPWEYLDGWAYRTQATGPDGSTFMIGNWTFSGPNALDGETSNATAVIPFPIGEYGGCSIPDSAPMVTSTTPSDNSTGVALDADISISFSEAVTVSGGWFEISCTTSGTHTAALSGGPQDYTLNPDADFVNDEACTLTVFASQVSDDDTDDPPDNMAADFVATFQTQAAPGVGSWIINEIHADPDSTEGDANGDGTAHFSDDEFVELFNDTGVPVNISGWTLADGFGVRHVFPTGTIVPDQCSIVVFGGGVPTGAFGGAYAQTSSTGALGLNNGGDTVTLNDGAIDQAMASYGGEGGNNQSLTLDPDVIGSLPWEQHTSATGSGGTRFSPGTLIDGSSFDGCIQILQITEIAVTPTAGEFVEIYNPGTTAVDLSDVYLTDATFFPGGVFYYNIVTGDLSQAGGGSFGDFHARFPDGASIGPGEYQTVALNGSGNFFTTYGVHPTYELYDDGVPDGVPAMREALPGSINGQGGLSNDGEVAILYYWNGATELVTDLDYALWGDKAEAVVKTGVRTYLDDTAFADQDVIASGSHNFGNTWQRDDLNEGMETKFGGNGAGGHDETSENVSETWCEDVPSPNAASDCPEFVPIELAIYEIQGDGASSPYEGEFALTTGVVVADFQGGDEMNGFFLQDPVGDGNPNTSDGIFIFDPGGTSVDVGDEISITGLVTEYFGLTELNNIADLQILSSGNGLPAPAPVTLPESVQGELERYEGMLVEIASASNMHVVQNFFLGRYGQMTLGSGGRLFQPTNQFEPGSAEALALADENARRLLILDDGQDISSCGDNPNPVPYLGSPPPAVIRAGDQVSNLVGALDYGRINSGSPCSDNATFARDYRLQPTTAPMFTTANARTAAPDAVGGSLKVASLNVLNYFTTLDGSGPICGPLGDQFCRGADSASEFDRQQTKIVTALAAIDADIVGLIELENNAAANPANDGTDPVLETLVNALNTAVGAGIYDFVDAGVIGSDAIKVAFIYKTATVTPVGGFAILDSTFNADFLDTKNRPVLAQTFQATADNARLTVAVNHLKSKGSPCDDVGDPTDPNGQGNCNLTRTKAAQVMVNWLATDPTGSGDVDFMIVGDLNAYAKEDPIAALETGGYTNLINAYQGSGAYSYIFDGLSGYLDHALSSSNLLGQVTGVTDWHINTDEPAVIDYDENFNPPGYYSPDAYRASDHDPVIVGLELNGPPVCTDAFPSLDSLKPPNHKFVDIDVLGVTDPEGDTITILIDSIFQDEAVDAPDSGNTSPDALGVGTSTASVRAERVGNGGNGRVYYISFTADDGNNNSCSGVVKVSVPVDPDTPVVDDGPLFDSTLIP